MERSNIESGTVLETNGNFATIVINKSKSCKECGKAQAGICGKGGAGMIMKVTNPINAVKGDDVTLGLGIKTQIKGYLLVFILPVAALMTGAYAGYLISQTTGIANLDVITGISFLVLSIAYMIHKVRDLDKSAQIHITGTLHKGQESLSITYPEEMDYLAYFDKGTTHY